MSLVLSLFLFSLHPPTFSDGMIGFQTSSSSLSHSVSFPPKNYNDDKRNWAAQFQGVIESHLIWLVVEPTHLKNMLVKLDRFPRDRGENNNYLSCHHQRIHLIRPPVRRWSLCTRPILFGRRWSPPRCNIGGDLLKLPAFLAWKENGKKKRNHQIFVFLLGACLRFGFFRLDFFMWTNLPGFDKRAFINPFWLPGKPEKKTTISWHWMIEWMEKTRNSPIFFITPGPPPPLK